MTADRYTLTVSRRQIADLFGARRGPDAKMAKRMSFLIQIRWERVGRDFLFGCWRRKLGGLVGSCV